MEGYKCTNTNAIKCEVGTISRTPPSNSCLPCLPGTYQDQEGQTSCKTCQLGKTCMGSKSTDCPMGKISNDGLICNSCPIGTYTDGPGSSKCKNCSNDEFCSPFVGKFSIPKK